jgi:hypothetical protein
MKNIIFLILLLFISCKEKDIFNDIPKPIVVTLPVTNVTSTTAFLNGKIVSDGGVPVSSKGFYFGPENEPSQIIPDLSIPNYNSTIIGCFVKDLAPGTVYKVRAWVNNGIFLIAGDSITFKTLN